MFVYASSVVRYNINDIRQWQVQDFPDAGAPTPMVEQSTYLFSPVFTENCMKIKEIGLGTYSWRPLCSANGAAQIRAYSKRYSICVHALRVLGNDGVTVCHTRFVESVHIVKWPFCSRR